MQRPKVIIQTLRHTTFICRTFLLLLAATHGLVQTSNAQAPPAVAWLDANTGAGGYGSGNAVAYDAAGNMYVAGFFNGEFNPDNSGATTTWMLTTNGGSDIYLAKYSSTGTLIWAIGMGGTSSDQLTGIAVDDSGYLYVAGYTGSTTSWDADPSSNTNTVLSSANNDMFMAKYDGTLTPSDTSFYKWAFAIGGSGSDGLTAIAVDGSGSVYVCGNINSTNWDADPSGNTNNITSGNDDMFIAKYDGTLTPSDTSFYKWAFAVGGTSTDQLHGIAVDGSGNVYVAGYTQSTSNWDADPSGNANNVASSGSFDMFIAKYDGMLTPSATGFYQWAFTMGGASFEQLFCLTTDGSGNVYVAGNTYSTLSWDADPSSGTSSIASSGGCNMFIAKYDGTLTPSNTLFYQWAFTMGGTAEQINGIAVDGSGNVYIAGYTSSTTSWDADPSSGTNNVASSDVSDMFIAKYDGTLTPASTSFYKWAFILGSTGIDAGNAIAINGSNKLYIAGRSNGPLDADPSTNTHNTSSSIDNQNILALIYDASIAPSSTSFYQAAVWAGKNTTNATITATATDALGNVYAAGYFGGTITLGTTSLMSNGGNDMYLAKYSSDGTLAWATSLGGTSTDQLLCLTTDGSGNVYVAGLTASTSNWDADPSSNTNYVKSSGNLDMFIAKYDGTLTPSDTSFYKWAFAVGGTSTDQLTGIAVDDSGNVYTAGNTGSTTNWDADPSANTNSVASSGSYDMFVAKYDGTLSPSSTSFYKWAFAMGGTSTDQLTGGIAVDGSGNVYVAGYTSSTSNWDADPSSNTNYVKSSGNLDMFIAKYDGTLTPSSTSFQQWAFAMGGTSTDQLTGIAVDGAGNVYVAGNTGSTTNWDADPSANTNSVASSGNYDMFIAKYDGTLTPSSTSFQQWAFAMGGTSTDQLTGIAVDGAGNVHVAGNTNSTTNWDADPGNNTNNVVSSGSTDMFIAKYNGTFTPDSAAFYVYAFTAGGSGSDQIRSITVGDGIIIGGYFTGNSSDFEPGSGSKTLTSALNGLAQSFFLGKYIEGYIWNGTTWSPSTPGSSDNAIINSSVAPTSFSCNDLTVNNGFALNTGTNAVVDVYGNFYNYGNGISGTGTVNFAKTGTANLYGDTLETEGTITVASGTLQTNGLLRLLSNATNTGRIGQSDGTITGNIMAQRYQPGKRAYRFYGHPFSSSIALSQLTDEIDITGAGGAGNGFTPTTTNNPSAFYWDVTTADNSTAGNNPGWQPFTSANTTSWDRYELLRLMVRGEKGQGLSGGSYTPSASTFEAAGEVNQGTQVITLTKGAGTNFAAAGNPFPSGIEMSTVTVGSNVGANYYVWDATSGAAGAYVTNPWTLPYVLPAYGAFFTTVSATDNITIEEADKEAGGEALFKGTAIANWVELLISDSATKWDRLLINLDDNAMDVEDNRDGKKLYNPGLDFFTLSKDGERLAVDVRPYDDGASIPLGLTAYNRYNKYVIKTGMVDIPAGAKLYLHDKWLNRKEELKPGFEYWFDVTTDTLSQGNNRFEIKMVGQPANGIAFTEKQTAKMQLVPNPAREEVKISFDKLEGKAQLKLTDVTGRVIFHREIDAATGSVIIPLPNIPAGIYIAELQSNNARFTEKLVKE